MEGSRRSNRPVYNDALIQTGREKEVAVKTQITATQNGVEVDITDVQGKEEQLLEAFHECSEGRCTCPTEEYKKMESLEVTDSDDAIQLSLKAKEGEQIDTKEIEKCLDYTRKRISDPPHAEETRPQD